MDMSTLGLGDELYAGLKSPFVAGFDAMQGRGNFFENIPKAFQQELAVGENAAADMRGLNPQAYDSGSLIGTAALMGRSPGRGAFATPGLAASTGTKGLVKKLAIQSGAQGAALGLGTPGTPQERAINAGAGGAFGAIVGAGGGQLLKMGAGRVPTPTVTQLFDQGDAAFKAARQSGAVVAPGAAQNTIGKLRQILTDEGAITPSGKVADLPKINHALTLADDYATGPVSMEQLLRVRKQFAKAAASNDRDERFLGTQLVRAFDDSVTKYAAADFIGNTAPAGAKAIKDWKTGQALWHTAKKSESVEGLVSSATRQSKKSAMVPREQAIRNKFDSFVGKEKNLRGFSPKEKQALQAVANGSAIGNVAKQVGRLAPTTMGGLTFKAGVPFAIGSYMGGPMAGGAAAAGTLGIGYLGKAISNISTNNKVKLAQALIQGGGKLPSKAAISALPKNVQNAVNAARSLGTTGGPTLANALLNQRGSQ